jgi:hypothetical protein
MTCVTRATVIFCSCLLMLSITWSAFALTWSDQLTQTPAIDVYYDFRPTIMGQPNWITPRQVSSAVSAFQTWSSVSNLNLA